MVRLREASVSPQRLPFIQLIRKLLQMLTKTYTAHIMYADDIICSQDSAGKGTDSASTPIVCDCVRGGGRERVSFPRAMS